MPYLSSGTKAFDDLMNGGFKVGKVHVLYGPYKIGKSIQCMQAACMATRKPEYGGLDKKALIIDSELFWDRDDFLQWYKWFKERWPDLPETPNIEILQLDTIFSAARLLGFSITIIKHEKKTEPHIRFPRKEEIDSKTGLVKEIKMTKQSEDWLIRSPLWKKVTSEEYGLVVFDSFTKYFKDVFVSVQQNYPGRASCERPFLAGLVALSKRKKLVTILVCHSTTSEGKQIPWGGENILYYSKHITGLLKALKSERVLYGDTEELEKMAKKARKKTIEIRGWRRVRRFYRFRHPILPDGEESIVVLELNKGFVDPVEVSTRIGEG